jgi:hypothetical protein
MTGLILVWQILFMNIIGAVGLHNEGYGETGYGLIFSAPTLLAAYILTFRKMSIVPAVIDIIGSAGYLQSIHAIHAISIGEGAFIPSWVTSDIAQNHMPSIVASMLIIVLCGFNFLLMENKEKRREKREKKLEADRPLTESERIFKD